MSEPAFTAHWDLPDGGRITRAVPAGQSLMEAARAALIPGIAGECGGTMSCATCHVHVDPGWADRLDPVSDHEDAMLDVAAGERVATSRLSCQIAMRPDLDGIVVRVPV